MDKDEYNWYLTCTMLVQLLHKLSIRAVNGNEKLLRVIENPVEKYLPMNSHKIGMLHWIAYLSMLTDVSL